MNFHVNQNDSVPLCVSGILVVWFNLVQVDESTKMELFSPSSAFSLLCQ